VCQGSGVASSCGVGCRCGSWLWCRLAAAALIRPLARELPYAGGEALKRKKKKKKRKERGWSGKQRGEKKQ